VKATEQYFNVLFIMLGKVALASESVDEFLNSWPFMLNVVALTFESLDEILKCDHRNESYSNFW